MSTCASLYGNWLLRSAATVAALFASIAFAAVPAPDRSTAGYEVDFMESMIDHHAMAVEMATLCEQRAVHHQLLNLCASIRETQSREIVQLQSWLQAWYVDSYQPEMTSADMRRMQKLASLSGAQFEIAFMQQMIQHHSLAIKEASTCLERAYHPELLELCGDIVATQSREIKQMRTWLCRWYGICESRKQ